jgi:hypothetical protein
MLLVKEKEMKMKQAQKKVGFIKKLKQICKLLKSKSSYTQMESSLPRKLNFVLFFLLLLFKFKNKYFFYPEYVINIFTYH